MNLRCREDDEGLWTVRGWANQSGSPEEHMAYVLRKDAHILEQHMSFSEREYNSDLA